MPCASVKSLTVQLLLCLASQKTAYKTERRGENGFSSRHTPPYRRQRTKTPSKTRCCGSLIDSWGCAGRSCWNRFVCSATMVERCHGTDRKAQGASSSISSFRGTLVYRRPAAASSGKRNVLPDDRPLLGDITVVMTENEPIDSLGPVQCAN